MNYFEAWRAEQRFLKYKELAIQYWSIVPQDTRDRHSISEGVSNRETDQSFQLREQISQLFPEVNSYAQLLGIGIEARSYPAPAIGGPVLPVNILESVVDRRQGHVTLSKTLIIDKINECIGSAQSAKRQGFWRLVLPWYWVIDIPALLVRIPFLILREAGVPAKVEENIISYFIKVIGVILILAGMVYLGLEKYIPQLLDLLK
jgi:hypothetical protein